MVAQVLAALDFFTLQPLALLFFSPCAFVDYNTTIVFFTTAPFLLLPITMCFSLLYFVFRAAKNLGVDWRAAVQEDWRGLLSESLHWGIRVYIELVQMVFMTAASGAFIHRRGASTPRFLDGSRSKRGRRPPRRSTHHRYAWKSSTTSTARAPTR